jgi:hypothetical protein
MTKIIIDIGDTASEILDVISPRRCYGKFHARLQKTSDVWLRRHKSISAEERYATRAGTPPMFWDQVRRGSSSGRHGRLGRKEYA